YSTQLKHINWGFQFENANDQLFFNEVVKCENLETLEIWSLASHLLIFPPNASRLNKLKSLKLRWRSDGSQLLRLIDLCPHIESKKLNLQFLLKMKNLIRLNFYLSPDNLTDDVFTNIIKECPHLTFMVIKAAPNITGKIINVLVDAAGSKLHQIYFELYEFGE